MQRQDFRCPCCGRTYVLFVVDGNMIVRRDEVVSAISDEMIAELASEMGVECGALKGGEKIG